MWHGCKMKVYVIISAVSRIRQQHGNTKTIDSRLHKKANNVITTNKQRSLNQCLYYLGIITVLCSGILVGGGNLKKGHKWLF